MSTSRPIRAQRSELAVPASTQKFIERAAQSAADAVFLDLEDAVAPEARAEARANAVRALQDVNWGDKTVAVRVNGLDTPWGLRDILEVASCARLDLVLMPKVRGAGDVRFVDRLLTNLEIERPRQHALGIEVLIETAKGLANVEKIAASSPRLEALIFGVGDYSIELQNFDLVFGESNPDYCVLAREDDLPSARHWNDAWHFALARIANACRAYGLRPIDGPFTNYGDPDGYIASCRRARALGFEGKWAIHPSQIELANKEFTPSESQVKWAREIVAAIQAANREGRGALGRGKVLIDQAHAKLAEKILSRAALVGLVR
jgi:malyl-CoA/(S)-citramalyl-CoA lyase